MRTTAVLRGFVLFTALACSGATKDPEKGPSEDASGDLDADADTDTDTDADADADTDTDTDTEDVTTGQTFCASGGVVSNEDFSGISCTSPLEIATREASNDSLNWQPGPTVFIAPRGGLK